jgi:hypothetical protein
VTSTPLFAKIVASKDAEFGAAWVRRDLQGNHGRCVSNFLVQDSGDAVSADPWSRFPVRAALRAGGIEPAVIPPPHD